MFRKYDNLNNSGGSVSMLEWLGLNKYVIMGIDLSLYFLVFLVLYLVIHKFLLRKNLHGFLFVPLILKVIGRIFGLTSVSALSDIVLVSIIVTLLITNEQVLKKKLATNNTSLKKKNVSLSADQRNNLYKMISDTVNTLSTNRIGAIMTFERDINLDEYIKNGVRINAPVCPELLTTIFYEGTTLHDGACIIRNGIIEAASVYYTPTTKALNGKYGARHRASLGISEVTDSITVVVSEETGRVSFAINGELQAVGRDVFYQTFKELMEK